MRWTRSFTPMMKSFTGMSSDTTKNAKTVNIEERVSDNNLEYALLAHPRVSAVCFRKGIHRNVRRLRSARRNPVERRLFQSPPRHALISVRGDIQQNP
jgi:hypothetical protein